MSRKKAEQNPKFALATAANLVATKKVRQKTVADLFRLYSVATLCRHLAVTPGRIHGLIDNGVLPARPHRLGKRYYWGNDQIAEVSRLVRESLPG